MDNLLKLVTTITYMSDDEVIDYFEDFFDINNLDNYSFDSLANQKEKESARMMFGTDDIYQRAVKVLDKDPLCLEAFYVFYRMADDYSLYLYFDKMFTQIGKFKRYSKYKKFAYKQIVDEYVTFLIEINSYTQAIAVEMDVIDKLEICGEGEITRLSFLFAMIEDFDNLYDLYIKVGFYNEASYICLIVTALKNNEEIKAIEALNDLISEYKYGEYIDHPWDLDKVDDDEAILMIEAMNACNELIRSVPYFIPWCRDNKKQHVKA